MFKRIFRLKFRYLGMTIFLLALLIMVAAPAFAQEGDASQPTLPPDNPLPTDPLKPPSQIEPEGLVPNNPYGCYGQTDNPHTSSHVPGTVNVVARTVCDYAVAEIHVETKLQIRKCFGFCWWSTIGPLGQDTNYFSTNATANSAADCVSGTHTYRGYSYHYVIGNDGTRYEGWTANEQDIYCS